MLLDDIIVCVGTAAGGTGAGAGRSRRESGELQLTLWDRPPAVMWVFYSSHRRAISARVERVVARNLSYHDPS